MPDVAMADDSALGNSPTGIASATAGSDQSSATPVNFIPVDHDPFNMPQYSLVPIDHDPFATPKPRKTVSVPQQGPLPYAPAASFLFPNLADYVSRPNPITAPSLTSNAAGKLLPADYDPRWADDG
jgi:hypothetical protein